MVILGMVNIAEGTSRAWDLVVYNIMHLTFIVHLHFTYVEVEVEVQARPVVFFVV